MVNWKRAGNSILDNSSRAVRWAAPYVRDGIVKCASKVGEGIVYATPRVIDGTLYVASRARDGIVYTVPHVRDGITYAAPRLQSAVNYVGPAVLTNAVGLAAVTFGVEGFDNLVNTPGYFELAETGLGLVAVNVVYHQIKNNGVSNYVMCALGKETGEVPRPMNRHLKTALITGSALALALSSVRISDSLDRIVENVNGKETVLIAGSDDNLVKEPRVDWASETSNLVTSGSLETDVQGYIDWLRSKNKVRDKDQEKIAIYVKDLHSGQVILNMNSDRQQMVASANKLYVLLGNMDQVQDGNLSYDNKLKTDLENMIRVSDNVATNRNINKVGLVKLNSIIHEEFGFSNTVLDLIPTGGRTLNNKSTALDFAKYFELLHNNQLPSSSEISRILKLTASGHADRLFDRTCMQSLQEKYGNSTLKITGGRVKSVRDKTGYIYGVNINVGLVTAEFQTSNGIVEVPYIIEIMVEDETAKQDKFRAGVWGSAKSEMLRSISEAVYWDRYKFYTGKNSVCKLHKNGRHPQ